MRTNRSDSLEEMAEMTSQIKFEYQYRDGANYKRFSVLIFENPLNRSAVEVESKIRSTLIEETWFVADQVGIPELFLFSDAPVTERDHCLHEFVSVDVVVNDSVAQLVGSIETLLEKFESSFSTGWKEFDPLERYANS